MSLPDCGINQTFNSSFVCPFQEYEIRESFHLTLSIASLFISTLQNDELHYYPSYLDYFYSRVKTIDISNVLQVSVYRVNFAFFDTRLFKERGETV